MHKITKLGLALLAIIAFAGSSFDGIAFRSRGDLLKIRQYMTTGPLDLFVETTGNDSNACTDVASPCLTFQGAVNKIPKLVQHPVKVKAGAGTFATGAIVDGFDFNPTGDAGTMTADGGPAGAQTMLGAYILIEGTVANFTPATGTATGTITASSIGSGVTFGTITDSTQTWTVDNLRGKMVEVLAEATEAGRYRMIINNTATVLTIAGTFASTPGVGTGYRIVENATIVNGVTPAPIEMITTAAAANNASAAFFLGPTTNPSILGTGPYGIRNIRFTGTRAVRTKGSAVIRDSAIETTGANPIVYGGEVQVSGSFISVPAGSGGMAQPLGSGYSKFQFLRSLARGAAGTGTFLVGSAAFTSVTSIDNSVVENVANGVAITGGSNSYGFIQSSIFRTITGTCYGLFDVSGTTFAATAGATIFISAQFDSCGIALEVNGATQLANQGTITGTGNTVGFRVQNAGVINIRSTTTLAATTELNIDGTGYTYANLRALVPKSIVNAATLSKIWEP